MRTTLAEQRWLYARPVANNNIRDSMRKPRSGQGALLTTSAAEDEALPAGLRFPA